MYRNNKKSTSYFANRSKSGRYAGANYKYTIEKDVDRAFQKATGQADVAVGDVALQNFAMAQITRKAAVRNTISQLPSFFLTPKKKIFYSAHFDALKYKGEMTSYDDAALVAAINTYQTTGYEPSNYKQFMPVMWVYCHLAKAYALQTLVEQQAPTGVQLKRAVDAMSSQLKLQNIAKVSSQTAMTDQGLLKPVRQAYTVTLGLSPEVLQNPFISKVTSAKLDGVTFASKFADQDGKVTTAPIDAAKATMVALKLTIPELLFNAGGYMDSAAWYVNGGYTKVDDYMQLTVYSASSTSLKSGWGDTSLATAMENVKDAALSQYRRECETLLFIDYNEVAMASKGFQRTVDGTYQSSQEGSTTGVDQFIFLSPELYFVKSASLTTELQALHAKINQEINQSKSFGQMQQSQYSVEQRQEMIKQEVAKYPPTQKEFFKPAVKIPYVDCIDAIYLCFPTAAGIDVKSPQFKFSTQPTYSRAEALPYNRFQGFYKRGNMKLIPNIGIAQKIMPVLNQDLVATFGKASAYSAELQQSQAAFSAMFQKTTITKPLLMKALDVHISAWNRNQQSIQGFVSNVTLFTATAIKAAQWLSAHNLFWNIRGSQGQGSTGWYDNLASPDLSTLYWPTALMNWRKFSEGQILTQEEYTALGAVQNLFTGEKLRKLSKSNNVRNQVGPAFRTLLEDPNISLMGVDKTDTGDYVASFPEARNSYLVEVHLFCEFVRSYRRTTKFVPKNPYAFDHFLRTLFAAGLPIDTDNYQRMCPAFQGIAHLLLPGRNQSIPEAWPGDRNTIFKRSVNNIPADQRMQSQKLAVNWWNDQNNSAAADFKNLHYIFKSDRGEKLLADPKETLRLLTILGAGQNDNDSPDPELVSRYKMRLIMEAEHKYDYTARNQSGKSRPNYARANYQYCTFQDPKRFTVLEPMTTTEWFRQTSKVTRTLLFQFVKSLYLLTYMHYSTMAYKGVSDYDIYLLLVHMTSWMAEYATHVDEEVLSRDHAAVLLQVPLFRSKKVTTSQKAVNVARNINATNATSYEEMKRVVANNAYSNSMNALNTFGTPLTQVSKQFVAEANSLRQGERYTEDDEAMTAPSKFSRTRDLEETKRDPYGDRISTLPRTAQAVPRLNSKVDDGFKRKNKTDFSKGSQLKKNQGMEFLKQYQEGRIIDSMQQVKKPIFGTVDENGMGMIVQATEEAQQ